MTKKVKEIKRNENLEWAAERLNRLNGSTPMILSITILDCKITSPTRKQMRPFIVVCPFFNMVHHCPQAPAPLFQASSHTPFGPRLPLEIP